MAELTGRRSGYSKGKGGSMHMFSNEKQLLWRPRHRRRQGAARHRSRLRQQVPRQRQCVPHLFRRRRRQPGPGLRGFNMAELWTLPVVYVIENNQYAMGTSVERASATTESLQTRRSPSTSRASRSTAWTCAPSRPRARWLWRMRRAGKGPIILEMHDLPLSRPLDVRPGQVPRHARKCRRCAANTIRSSRCDSGCRRRSSRAKTN